METFETTTPLTETTKHPTYEETLNVQLGETIRAIMRTDGVTVKALSTKTGLSASTINKLVAGRANPRLSTLIKVATALGYTLEVKLV